LTRSVGEDHADPVIAGGRLTDRSSSFALSALAFGPEADVPILGSVRMQTLDAGANVSGLFHFSRRQEMRR
jgi:hypothetical protein